MNTVGQKNQKIKRWKGLKSFLGLGMAGLGANIILMAVLDDPVTLTWMVYVGFGICIPAILLWIFAVTELKKKGMVPEKGSYMDTTTVVSTGIFGIIRHPQYLAYILLNVGIMLFSQNWIALVIAVASSVFLYLGMKEEEGYLINQFGSSYQEYKDRVPKINLFSGIVGKIYHGYK